MAALAAVISVIVAIIGTGLWVAWAVRTALTDAVNGLKQDMNAMETRLTGNIAGVEARLDRVESRLDKRLDRIENRTLFPAGHAEE